jgi:endoplasmic reticulum-Golgi intermediate compartment protein 2
VEHNGTFIPLFSAQGLTTSPVMNMSHVINEFSFGPYFPDITQPLDFSYEMTEDGKSFFLSSVTFLQQRSNIAFTAYQYFLTVVPTTYIVPRAEPLHTNQYSVTHYKKVLMPHLGVPGIFFKFEIDPMSLSIHQRTTTFLQLIIRYFYSLYKGR